MFLGRVLLLRFAFQGLNITFLEANRGLGNIAASQLDVMHQSIFKSNTLLYSRVSRDSVIAASAVEKSCFFILRYYRKCN